MHTPGPWTAHPDRGLEGGPWIEAAKPNTRIHIAHVSNGNEANARLIAAAPDYDAAARAAVESYRTPRVEGRRYVSISIEAFQALEAAISKAEGQP